jgi:hypothetical protein
MIAVPHSPTWLLCSSRNVKIQSCKKNLRNKTLAYYPLCNTSDETDLRIRLSIRLKGPFPENDPMMEPTHENNWRNDVPAHQRRIWSIRLFTTLTSSPWCERAHGAANRCQMSQTIKLVVAQTVERNNVTYNVLADK